jgi:hypothetical protein
MGRSPGLLHEALVPSDGRRAHGGNHHAARHPRDGRNRRPRLYVSHRTRGRGSRRQPGCAQATSGPITIDSRSRVRVGRTSTSASSRQLRDGMPSSLTSSLRLAVFDIDGTLRRVRDPWVHLHKHLGVADRACEFIPRWQRGEISYDEWARLDASLWRGVGLQQCHRP